MFARRGRVEKHEAALIKSPIPPRSPHTTTTPRSSRRRQVSLHLSFYHNGCPRILPAVPAREPHAAPPHHRGQQAHLLVQAQCRRCSRRRQQQQWCREERGPLRRRHPRLRRRGRGDEHTMHDNSKPKHVRYQTTSWRGCPSNRWIAKLPKKLFNAFLFDGAHTGELEIEQSSCFPQ
jgi:hypothetical protein